MFQIAVVPSYISLDYGGGILQPPPGEPESKTENSHATSPCFTSLFCDNICDDELHAYKHPKVRTHVWRISPLINTETDVHILKIRLLCF